MEAKAVELGGAAGSGSRLRYMAAVTLAAAVVTAAVNVSLFLIGELLGAFPETAVVPRWDGPLTLGPVLVLSAIAPVAGTGIYVVLRKATDRAFPIFLALAAVVLVFMAIPPFQIENGPHLQVILLQAMHGVTAGATLVAVSRLR